MGLTDGRRLHHGIFKDFCSSVMPLLEGRVIGGSVCDTDLIPRFPR